MNTNYSITTSEISYKCFKLFNCCLAVRSLIGKIEDIKQQKKREKKCKESLIKIPIGGCVVVVVVVVVASQIVALNCGSERLNENKATFKGREHRQRVKARCLYPPTTPPTMAHTPPSSSSLPPPVLYGDFELAGSKVTGNSLVSFLRHSDAFPQML